MNEPDTKRQASAEAIFDGYPAVGYNDRISDMQAAVGCEQLKRLPEIVDKRRALTARYNALLATIQGLGLPRGPSGHAATGRATASAARTALTRGA